MKQLAILSGKGGTGKTSITACFAVLAKDAVLVDCDVDAPDLHMLLHPEVNKETEFIASKIAIIDESKCTKCGLCREKCKFDAINDKLEIVAIACEGCGVCEFICPTKAITLAPRVSGKAYISKIKYGLMSHALLFPGESNSGKLVTLIRQNAKVLAEKQKKDLIIIDGSPGIGCPVIASITGVDGALVITEPTMSGIHDLERVLKLLDHFNVIPFVCINMYDVNVNNTNRILSYCREKNIEVIGVIPFDPIVTQAMVNGKTVVEHSPESTVTGEIRNMWTKLSTFLGV